MIQRSLFFLFVAGCLSSLGCGSGSTSSTYADKCRLACDPSAVMACTTMDPANCQRDCMALTNGLTATCATCVTQTNSWQYGRDHRGSGSSACSAYAFPSITDLTSSGCGNSCK